MARAATNFVRMGAIQGMGAGKTVPATRDVPPGDYLLPTSAFLSSISGQSIERSAAGEAHHTTATGTSSGTTTGTSSGDASDAGAKTAHRHTA
jgi:hypothetical protein